MGKRGPKVTPINIRELRGNPGKRKKNGDAPKVPVVKELPVPDWITDPVAIEEWARVVPILDTYGIITTLDETILAAYVLAYSRWRTTEGQLDGAPLVVTVNRMDKQGNVVGTYPMQNPTLSVNKGAFKQMHQCLAELGLTPSARATLIAGKGGDPNDPLGLA